jgi:hypothetical protein
MFDRVSWALYLSGIAAIVSAIGHSFLGERYLIQPLLAANIPFLKPLARRRLLRGILHLASVAWFGIGAMLIYEAQQGAADPAWLYFIVPVFALSGLMNLWALRSVQPGWIAMFIAAAALAYALLAH